MDSSFTKRQNLFALLIFTLAVVAILYRAIFCGEVLASVDLLGKELPWQAVVPPVSQIDNFTCVDVFTVFYPWKHFVHDELQAGRFPLWCKSVGCGYPLAGQGCVKLFGLTTGFLWFSSPRVASILTYSSQLMIAMAGMYALLGALRLRWGPAVFGALVYGLNSAMFQYLEFEHITGGLMFLPWVCWALWLGVKQQERRRRFYALAGLFFGLTIINGSLQSAVIVWLSAAGFVVAALWERGWRGALGLSFMAIISFSLLGVMVGAIALMPNLELFSLNSRARFVRIDWIELTWKRIVAIFPIGAAMLNPDVIGNYRTFDMMRALGRIGTGATWPSMSDVRVYCGLGAIVLAALGVRSGSEAKRMGAVLVAVPVIVAILTPLFLILYFRVLAASAAGIAILAALGLERLGHPDDRLGGDCRKAVLVLVAAIVVTLGVGAVVTVKRAYLQRRVEDVGLSQTSVYKSDKAWQMQKARETVQNFTLGGHAIVRFCGLAAIVGVALVIRGKPGWVLLLLAALNTADLVEFARRVVPSVAKEYEYPMTPALEFLRTRDAGHFRVSSTWDGQIQPPTARANLLLPYGIDDARVYESLVPANPLLGAENWSALNVRFMICPASAAGPTGDWRMVYHDEVDIYENPNTWPRVYFTTDLSRAPVGPVQIEEYVSGQIRARVDAPTDGWVVVGERHYPGWRAQVNGQRTQIARAQGLWQAIPVRAGANSIDLRYQPRSVLLGGALSLIGIVAAGVMGWPWKRH